LRNDPLALLFSFFGYRAVPFRHWGADRVGDRADDNQIVYGGRSGGLMSCGGVCR
jgi:hypothetical protein